MRAALVLLVALLGCASVGRAQQLNDGWATAPQEQRAWLVRQVIPGTGKKCGSIGFPVTVEVFGGDTENAWLRIVDGKGHAPKGMQVPARWNRIIQHRETDPNITGMSVAWIGYDSYVWCLAPFSAFEKPATTAVDVSTPAFKPSTANTLATAPPPQFAQYPAIIYRGPLGRLDLSSPASYQFRTRLREGARRPVNFAGHYQLVEWGCGASCTTGAIIDVFTGRVTFLPSIIIVDTQVDENFRALEFRENSRMVVLSGQINGTGISGAHFNLWNGERLEELSVISSVPWCGSSTPSNLCKQSASIEPSTASKPAFNSRAQAASQPSSLLATPTPIVTPRPFAVAIQTSISGGACPVIAGITNLPNGTQLYITLQRPWLQNARERLAVGLAACGADCLPVTPGGFGGDAIVVTKGQFRYGPITDNGNALSPGVYVLEIEMRGAMLEPPEVRSIIGQRGENMMGPLVGGCCFGSHNSPAEIQKTMQTDPVFAQFTGARLYYGRFLEVVNGNSQSLFR